MTSIELCRAELWHAAEVGVKRRAMHRYALAKGEKRQDRNEQRGGEQMDSWDEIESACAEYATSKYLQRFWPGDWWCRNRTVDILPDIEVRWTKYSESGHLLLYDSDLPDFRYVLVTGSIPTYSLLGWLYGHEAMRPEFRRSLKPGRPEMFVVGREQLRPIEDLK